MCLPLLFVKEAIPGLCAPVRGAQGEGLWRCGLSAAPVWAWWAGARPDLHLSSLVPSPALTPPREGFGPGAAAGGGGAASKGNICTHLAEAELLCWGAAARQQQAWGRGEHERWPDTAPPPPPWPVGRNTCSKELTRFFWAAARDAQVHPVQVGVTQKPLQPLG